MGTCNTQLLGSGVSTIFTVWIQLLTAAISFKIFAF